MAVLTRPLFHAQERIDLEDFNQLLSGLRTDSKLYTRQVLGDKNYILSGFNASGLNTPQLTVDVLGASMLFAGREAPVGTSNITIIDNALLPDNSSTAAELINITFTKDDGSTIVFSQGAIDNASAGIWTRGADATATAVSIRNAIVGLASDEFPVASNPTPTTGVVNLTTSSDDIGQGFINIEVSPSGAGFQRLSDTVINSFDYTGDIVESPSDLSWWTLHSDATAAESRLTQEITSQFRAPTGTAIRTLIVYAKLVTEEATPITKAFWDPSANSGSGAEFNQRVNTAVDLAVELNFQDSPLTGSELFANTEVCRLEVDGSGNILAIRDTRDLYFEGVDTYDWNRTAPFATITTLTDLPANITTPLIGINSFEFQVNERVNFFTLTDATTNVTPAATSKITSATDGATPILGLEKFDLSAISTYGYVVVGLNSGAVRLVNTINSNFVRDDKELSSFKEWVDAVTTGIRQAKGTDNWFDDVDGNVQDALSFINSTIIANDDLSVFRWEPSSTGGTLNIETNPAALADFTFATVLNAGDTISIGDTIFSAIANAATPGTNQFRIGTTATESATNFDTVANNNSLFTAVRDGLVVTVSTTDRANFVDTNVMPNAYRVVSSNTSAVAVTRQLGQSASADLVAIRVFNRSAKLLLQRQAIAIPADHILYITFPLDVDFADDGNGIGLRYDGVVDFNTARALANYNATDPIFGELNNPNLVNNFVGLLKTIPIGEFVNDGRNYWVAACEETIANEPSILHIRGVGAVNGNESIPVGEGVTNNTISYIGAAGPNDSTPDYPSVTSIDTHGTSNQSAYTIASAFNTNVISQSENLTRAISDINDHLVTLKDVNYQDKGIKLVGGGFWSWDVTGTNANELQITDDAFIQVPGLPNASNQIQFATFNALGTLADGQVIQAVINRTTTAGNPTLSIVNIDAVTPGMNTFILARRIGINVQLGIPAAMRLAPGEVSPIDGALAFFGLQGRNGELPRQLRTSIEGNQQVDIESADAVFRIGGFTDSLTPADDTVTLTIPVGTGILQWEGASFTVTTPPIGVSGLLTVDSIFHTPGEVNFRERSAATTFVIPSLDDGESMWVGLAIGAADSGIGSGDTDEAYLTSYANANPDLPTFFGRRKGEPGVSFGTPSSIAGELVFAEFDGDVPVAQVLLTRTGSALNVLSNSDVVVLGASGGGGGGGGSADQDLNNYLNRLNLSTFGYVTPVIAAVSTTIDIDDSNLTTAGLSTSGFALPAAAALTTTTLLDPEFINEGLIPNRLEIEGIWGKDPSDPSIAFIDPNAIWSISFNSSSTDTFSPLTSASVKNVIGYITGAGALVGTNLTNAPLTQIDTVFIENHGFSTGHKVTLNTGSNLTFSAPTATPINPPANEVRYVRAIDADSFELYDTATAASDLASTTNRVTLSGTSVIDVTLTLAAGIIPRVGNTDTVRAIFDTGINSVLGTPYSTNGVIDANAIVRLRVVGDTNSQDRGQGNEPTLSSLALFYADELGVEGVNPNGLDDVLDILRTSHLANTENELAGFQVPGRGIVLQDNSTGDPLLELAFNMGALSIRAADGTYQAIAARDAEGNLIVP